MAEVINEDLLIGTLRYLDAIEQKKIGDIPIDTRHSTFKVVVDLLYKFGYIDNNNRISRKGTLFLERNKLRSFFKVDYTPFGVVYDLNNAEFVSEVRKILKHRPKPDCSLDHQPLWPELTAMRAHYISSEEHLYNKRVAMVGDYDSTGLALSLITKIKDLSVFDIDRRILNYFEEVAKKYSFNLKKVEQDFFKPIPKQYKGMFDVFITDPPYALGGMLKFIEFGITLLNKNGVGYIAVPYHENIDWTNELLFEVNKLIAEKNCVITDILKNFHDYQTADGLRSSMLRIKKVPKKIKIKKTKMYSYKQNNVNKPIIKLAMI